MRKAAEKVHDRCDGTITGVYWSPLIHGDLNPRFMDLEEDAQHCSSRMRVAICHMRGWMRGLCLLRNTGSLESGLLVRVRLHLSPRRHRRSQRRPRHDLLFTQTTGLGITGRRPPRETNGHVVPRRGRIRRRDASASAKVPVPSQDLRQTSGQGSLSIQKEALGPGE